ncbi:MAG: hypothetical protein AAGJ35_03945, partial [Myxococcota bacterium]
KTKIPTVLRRRSGQEQVAHPPDRVLESSLHTTNLNNTLSTSALPLQRKRKNKKAKTISLPQAQWSEELKQQIEAGENPPLPTLNPQHRASKIMKKKTHSPSSKASLQAPVLNAKHNRAPQIPLDAFNQNGQIDREKVSSDPNMLVALVRNLEQLRPEAVPKKRGRPRKQQPAHFLIAPALQKKEKKKSRGPAIKVKPRKNASKSKPQIEVQTQASETDVIHFQDLQQQLQAFQQWKNTPEEMRQRVKKSIQRSASHSLDPNYKELVSFLLLPLLFPEDYNG